MFGHGLPGADRRRAQHEAFFDVRAPAERRVERAIKLGERHFGEEAEAAEIHAEDRNGRPRFADAIGHPEQRAVAAEHEDHVDLVDERALLHDAAPRPGNHQGRGRRFEHGGDAALFQPCGNFGEVGRRLTQVRLGDDTDARNGTKRLWHERFMEPQKSLFFSDGEKTPGSRSRP